MSDEGLDPDAAIQAGGGAQSPPPGPKPIIDTRPYQRFIAGFGLLLVVICCIYLAFHGSGGSPGFAPGQKLHTFVAPLASSDYGDNVRSNTTPRCDPAHPNRRGLNVCDSKPIVLAFTALGAKDCIRQVDAMQQIAGRFPRLEFAAVVVNGNRRATAALVRSHHWRLPVAYDPNGAVGAIYGVEVCPLLELAKAGGVVQQRLIGKDWERPAQLARAVRKLAG